MDLHGFVSGAIGAVNPHTTVTIRKPTGMTTTPDGRRVPTYQTIRNVPAQVQPLSHDDLEQREGLNMQGQKTSIYLHGKWAAIVRGISSPAPLFVINGVTWAVAVVLEDWQDWTKLALVRQLD